MDSTFDRWGEAVVYIGIVWGCLAADANLAAVLAAAAMASAFMRFPDEPGYARPCARGLNVFAAAPARHGRRSRMHMACLAACAVTCPS